MIPILALFVGLLFQTPAASPAKSVVVGLLDGQQLAIDNPRFTGFIETRQGGEAVLLYRQKTFHGELKLSAIQRIDFSYRRGQPFILDVTLINGQKLNVQADRRDFVVINGPTDTGTISIKHPDPISSELRLSTRKPNRQDDLTIQYLEFPR